MAIINTGATTLADIANLTQDSDLQKKVLIQTIRDYSGFFDQLTLIPANDGTACKGTIITEYPEGEIVGYNEGWGTSQAKGRAVRYDSFRVRTSSEVDADLLDSRKPEDRDTFRLRKDAAVMRGLARQAAKSVFFGSGDASVCITLSMVQTMYSMTASSRVHPPRPLATMTSGCFPATPKTCSRSIPNMAHRVVSGSMHVRRRNALMTETANIITLMSPTWALILAWPVSIRSTLSALPTLTPPLWLRTARQVMT